MGIHSSEGKRVRSLISAVLFCKGIYLKGCLVVIV